MDQILYIDTCRRGLKQHHQPELGIALYPENTVKKSPFVIAYGLYPIVQKHLQKLLDHFIETNLTVQE